MMWRRLLIVLVMIGCGESGPQLNTTESMTAGDMAPSEVSVGGTTTASMAGMTSPSEASAEDDELLYVPQAPMRDTDRPAWRADAALSFGLGGDGIVVTWPEAIDNVAVAAYSIFLSGSLVARVPGDNRSQVLEGLKAQQSYSVVVIASDAEGNRSEGLVGQYTLMDRTAPSWPELSMVRVSDVTATAATLTWTPANDDVGVVGYELRVDDTVLARVDMTTQHRLVDLQPRTRYSIDVVAIDAAGLSSATALSVGFETQDDRGPMWPNEPALAATQTGPHSVQLSWPEASDDAEGIRYEVSENGVVLGSTEAMRWTRTDISTPAMVEYSVKAMDRRGVVSDEPLRTTLEVSDQTPPTWPAGSSAAAMLVDGSSVHLRWDAAVDNDVVTGYRVTWDGGEETVQMTSMTISGLAAVTAYTARVVAIDAAGNASEDALSVTATTADVEAPTWPAEAALELVWREGTLDMAWPEAVDDDAVVGYTVLLDGVFVTRTEPERRRHRLLNLVAAQSYTLTVLANDAAHNRSAPLSATYRVSDEVPPSWPDGAQADVIELTPTSARVQWTSATDNVGVVAYEIRLNDADVVRVGAGGQHLLTALNPRTAYTVTVTAVDGAGLTTAQSVSVQFETPDDDGPGWPDTAVLTAEQSGPTDVVLSWPEAQNDVGITRYRVEENGVVMGHVETTTWHRTPVRTPGQYDYLVWAIDGDGVASQSPLSARLEVSDQTRPEWPVGAVVTATAVAGETIALRWDAAVDNHRIDHYLVTWDGGTRQVEGPAITLEGLAAATTYGIRVVAVDASGNVTVTTLSADVATIDVEAPTWPAGSTLDLVWLDEDALQVTWPAAQDNVGVSRYTITRNTDAPESLGDMTTHRYEGLAAGVDHVIHVVAFDGAGLPTGVVLQGTARRANAAAPQWPSGAALLVSNLTETGVRLAWPMASDPGDQLSYTLSWGEQSVTTSDSQVQVDGLAPWTDYTFTVSVRDTDGHQAATDLTAQLKTPDITPPVFPVGGDDGVHAVDIGEDFAVVSWLNATDNVAVTGYTLSVDGGASLNFEADQTQGRIEGLRPWQVYRIEVSAVDAAGHRSVEPVQLVFKTADETAPWWPEVAVAQTVDLSANSVTLVWPAAQDNVAITRYVVQVDGEPPFELDANARSATFGELLPWQSYRLTVHAEDAAGQLSPTLATEIFTPDTEAPTWPAGQSLVPSQIESTALTVGWPVAVDDAGVIRYRILADGLDVGETGGAARSFRIEGLQPAQMVLVNVVAIDAAGNESASLSLSVTPPDGGPPTWTDTTLDWQSGLNQATLSWPAAQDDVGVTGYRVVVDGDIKFETHLTNALVEGLLAGKSYSVRIDAKDAANNWSGDGPSASLVTVERAYEGFRRLSKLEYTRAVAHLWQWVYGTDEDPNLYCDPNRSETRAHWCKQPPYGFDGWISRIPNLLGAYPFEEPLRGEHELGGGFRRVDQRLFDEHIGVWTYVAGQLMDIFVDLANEDGGNGPRGYVPRVHAIRCEREIGLASAFPDGVLAHTRLCYQLFVEKFASRALRRKLTDAELETFMTYFDRVPLDMQDRFQFQRQLWCWIGIHGPRAQPRPTSWQEGDEDWCAQLGPDELDEYYPKRAHLSFAMMAFIPVVMNSPEFLYHVEIGEEDGALTAHELANRLSFHFWRAPPDKILRALADSGDLLDPDIYAAEVERLFEDPRAEEGVRTFYNGYFWLESVPNKYQGEVAYLRAHEEWHPGEWRQPGYWPEQSPFGQAAKDELSNLGYYFTREQPGTYRDMFTSNLNFLQCQGGQACNGAGVFGLSIYKVGDCADVHDCRARNWNRDTKTGYWPGDDPVEIPEPNRYGLITRIGFLMHETDKERPIRRGLKIRDMLLCDPIPPPENCDVVRVPILTGLCMQNGVHTGRECSHNSHCDVGQVCDDPFKKNRLTVRDVVEEITEVPGTSCATCHARWINGMGHALNNYSSQGLYRPHEPMREEANILNGKPRLTNAFKPQDEWPAYNTVGEFQFEGQQYTVDGAEELADFLADSGQLESCWAQQYFRYTMGRLETESDLPTIESLADQLRNGVSLAEVYKNITFTDAFKSISKPSPQRSSEDAP